MVSITSCNDDDVCPIIEPEIEIEAELVLDPCSYDAWPEPPYGYPDHLSTRESVGDSTRVISYQYDCLADTAYVIIHYYYKPEIDDCWFSQVTTIKCN